jgi:hypothetical protein
LNIAYHFLGCKADVTWQYDEVIVCKAGSFVEKLRGSGAVRGYIAKIRSKDQI